MAVTAHEHWIDTPCGQLFAMSWEAGNCTGTPLVLLHDSLGCVALWRDFPGRLAALTRRRVIAYDRFGYGRSAPRNDVLTSAFINNEARDSIAHLIGYFGLSKYIAVGHSVGGAMAIACAASAPTQCDGVITIAAQAYVDTDILNGIREAKKRFEGSDGIDRLSKYHGDKARWVLDSWIQTWLAPEFSDWNLRLALGAVRCPVLAVHGDRDEYGSSIHARFIEEQAAGPASAVIVPDCGHFPHREKPEEVFAASAAFLKSVGDA